jgi:hypothetical protein
LDCKPQEDEVRSLSRRQFVSALSLLGMGPNLGHCAATDARAAEALAQQKQNVLFENVRIFESGRMRLSGPTHALLGRNGLKRVEVSPTDGSVSVIAGKGRTLMPELIEAHARMITARPTGEALVEIPEWNYVMLLGNAQSTTRTRVPASQFAEQFDCAVDVGIVIAPRIWPKGVVISGLDTSQSSVHAGNGRPSRHGSLVATAPSAYKEVNEPQSAAFSPASASYWGAFASVHAGTAHPIVAAMPGASGSRAVGSERFASMLLVWQARPFVSVGVTGEGARRSI